MGKLLPSPARVQNFARIISSERIKPPKQTKSTSNSKVSHSNSILQVKVDRFDPAQLSSLKMEKLTGRATRTPLSEVVSDCVQRWFEDTLQDAKAGDSGMQLLVGQMYNSGYGVRKDTHKGRAWITKASKGRSSAFRSSNKHPGYNASDSDSEDLKDARS